MKTIKYETQKGFTVLELMIVLVIVGILASIVIPTYQNSVIKAQREDGMAALVAASSEQERFRAEWASYTDIMGQQNGACPGNIDCGLNLGTVVGGVVETEGGFYEISVDVSPIPGNPDAAGACGPGATPCTSFRFTATPIGRQVDDPCGFLTIDNQGNRGSEANDRQLCW